MVALLGGCVDQTGGDRQADEQKNIVATSVTICEILDALEIENVIGVPQTDTYSIPERYQKAVSIGAAMNPDMEIIVTLEPDVILSPASLAADLQTKYENAGIDSYFLDLSSTESMYGAIQELGYMFGRKDQAAALNREFEDYMQSYREEHSQSGQPKVLLLMGLPGSYVTATDASYAGSLVKLAGGENVYGDDEEAFLNVNPEDMLGKDPDIILLTSHALPEQVEKMFEKEFSENDVWKHFRAVEEGRVYTLDHNKFGMSANFNYREALDDLQELLYETDQ